MSRDETLRVPAMGSGLLLAAGLVSGPVGFVALRWWLVSAAVAVGLGAVFGLVPQPGARKLFCGFAMAAPAGVTVKVIAGLTRGKPGWTGDLAEFVGYSLVILTCLAAGYAWTARRVDSGEDAVGGK